MTEAFETLTDEVRGLRADLIEYRESVASVLARRIRVLTAVGVVALVAIVTIGAGAFSILRVEEHRTEAALATSRAEACIVSRNVQAQMIQVVRALPEDADERFVEAALDALAADPCNIDRGDER